MYNNSFEKEKKNILFTLHTSPHFIFKHFTRNSASTPISSKTSTFSFLLNFFHSSFDILHIMFSALSKRLHAIQCLHPSQSLHPMQSTHRLQDKESTQSTSSFYIYNTLSSISSFFFSSKASSAGGFSRWPTRP